ncbi:DUF6044 family protein [Spirosoma areae]
MLLAIGLLALYVFPYIWLGQGAYLTIHDNLDSDFIYLHLLRVTRTAFAFDLDTVLPNMMSSGRDAIVLFRGIPRSALRTGLNLEVLSFWVLPPYTAQILNFVAVHGIGFVGMYLLLRKHVLPEPGWALTRVTLAFLFALVPCYINHGASVSGQPLVLFAFLNLLTHRSDWRDWFITAVFPFYSFFVWAGLFICVALGILGLAHMLHWRRINWSYLTGLSLLSVLYLGSEWELIYGFINQTYVSHRTEYDYARLLPVSVGNSLRKSYDFFVQTQYHAGAFITLWIVFVVGLAGIRDYRNRHWTALKPIVLLTGCVAITCLLTGFYWFPATWLGRGSFLQAFQFDRFYFLLPTLWFILFALALRQFQANGRWNRLFLAGQFVVMITANKEWRINVGKLTGYNTEAQYPSFRAFFAEKQFAQIRDYIHEPQADYRVICLGMHPAVAQFNGFYTLDSYQNNYPLLYKHAFRKIIETELAKGSDRMRVYYDAYACRAYLYTAELGMSYLFGKTQKRAVNHLQINTNALASLGGEYIISAVPIRNAAENKLRLEKIFDEPESYWRVWLYRVN